MNSFALSLRAAGMLTTVAIGGSLLLWACSSSTTSGDGTSQSDAGNAGDATSTGAGDAAQESGPAPGTVDAGPPECDAAIVECVTNPTMKSPTINVPSACGAPAFDAYSTTDNEQVTAACNDFCVKQNPAYADAGGFVGCNQTPAEQALGDGAFHCVCAP
jgi:hypothetical protein